MKKRSMKHLQPETKKSPKQGLFSFFRGENMTNDAAMKALLDYLEKSDSSMDFWTCCRFEERCFSRWAACEIIEAIMNHPMVEPENVIEEFLIKMILYSSISTNIGEKKIFSTAAHFADKCLKLFE